MTKVIIILYISNFNNKMILQIKFQIFMNNEVILYIKFDCILLYINYYNLLYNDFVSINCISSSP